MTNREDAHLLSGAYALGAVTEEEAALVEAAMQESEELRSEVVGLADTAVALGLGLTPVKPPPSLRARLLDAIDSAPQEAPVAVDATADPAAEVRLVDETGRDRVPSGTHVVPRRRRSRRPMVLLALAAAAAVLFGGGFFVQGTLLAPQSEYTAITAASDVRNATARVEGGGTATVSWSESEHRTAVVLTGVSAPAGKVLQLWSVRDGTPTSAGLYDPRAGQRYAVISGTPNSGEYLAVTVEPEGGSTQPTSKTIVAVKLTA